MDSDRWESPYHEVIFRAFVIAGESGELGRPLHLLAALADVGGPISEALSLPGSEPLFARPADPPRVHGGGAGYLVMQTHQAAGQFASTRGEAVAPEHLFLTVLHQGEAEAVAHRSGPVTLRNGRVACPA